MPIRGDALERQLEKVAEKRQLVQTLCAFQIALASIWFWVCRPRSSSALTYQQGGIFAGCVLVGLVGWVAVFVRRVQLLAIFAALEIFCAMLVGCSH